MTTLKIFDAIIGIVIGALLLLSIIGAIFHCDNDDDDIDGNYD